MGENRKLAEQIASLAAELPFESIEQISCELEKLPPGADIDSISGTVRHIQHPAIRAAFSELFSTIKSECPGIGTHSIALALRSTSSALHTENREVHLELVWSGPSKTMSTLRRTDQALSDLIDDAQHSLTIVSFAVYKVPHIMSSLINAIERDVSVTLILETEKESDGKLTSDGLKEIKRLGLGGLGIHVWPESARHRTENGRAGVLHAKCAVEDSKVALISSANLTEAAMHLNMELGLIVRGGTIPSFIEDHFESLILGGILKRVS